MSLYRNIAGVDQGMGLVLLNQMTTLAPGVDWGSGPITPPTVVEVLPPGTSWTSSPPIEQQLDYRTDVANALETEMNGRYDWMMKYTAWEDINNAGVTVDPATGNLIWHGGEIFLELQWIQAIENARGTAGALLMHFGEPVLAKDTAGYAGGGRASQGATVMYSTPIPEVLALPIPPTGDNVINEYHPPIATAVETTPLGGTDTTPPVTTPPTTVPTTQQPATTTPTPTATKSTLPLLTIAGLSLVIIAGDRLLKKRQKLAFVGGLGLLYFTMTKKQTI